MKKPLDFDVASNPHNALLATEEHAHDYRRSFLQFSFGGLAATSPAVIFPQAVRGEGHALEIKKGDSMLNQHRLVI